METFCSYAFPKKSVSCLAVPLSCQHFKLYLIGILGKRKSVSRVDQSYEWVLDDTAWDSQLS